MPKNKTHSGAKKRFRTTGLGKISRRPPPAGAQVQPQDLSSGDRSGPGAPLTSSVKRLLGKRARVRGEQ